MGASFPQAMMPCEYSFKKRHCIEKYTSIKLQAFLLLWNFFIGNDFRVWILLLELRKVHVMNNISTDDVPIKPHEVSVRIIRLGIDAHSPHRAQLVKFLLRCIGQRSGC